MEEHYPIPDIAKMNKSEKYSPRTRKRFQMKNELGPIKPLPLDMPNPIPIKEPLKLEKKPSRKLVIKANEKRP